MPSRLYREKRKKKIDRRRCVVVAVEYEIVVVRERVKKKKKRLTAARVVGGEIEWRRSIRHRHLLREKIENGTCSSRVRTGSVPLPLATPPPHRRPSQSRDFGVVRARCLIVSEAVVTVNPRAKRRYQRYVKKKIGVRVICIRTIQGPSTWGSSTN